MKKMIFSSILILFIIIVLSIAKYSYQDNNNYIILNDLVHASWTNVGSMVIITDSSQKELKDAIIADILFEKEMFRGKPASEVVEEYIKCINDRYNNQIKVERYTKTDKQFILEYINQDRITWNYEINEYKVETS